MAVLTPAGKTATSISINVAGGPVQLELNRAADFSSDDSIIVDGFGGGAIGGLPSSTAFYARGRVGAGAWSAPIVIATGEPGAVAPDYAISIEPAILVVPEPIAQISSAQAAAGAPADNLIGDDPTAAMRAPGGGVTIDAMTAGRPADVVALMGTLMGPTATWQVQAGDAQGAAAYDSGVQTFHASPNLGRRAYYHSFLRLPAPVAYPWWRITVTNPGPAFIARNLIIGLARQSKNFAKGAGQAVYDLGTMNRTPFGTPDRVPGWRGRALDFALSWLGEAEYQAKWADLETIVGTTYPVFVLPNSKPGAWLHDRMGFGTIDNMRGENVQSSKFARAISVRSLY